MHLETALKTTDPLLTCTHKVTIIVPRKKPGIFAFIHVCLLPFKPLALSAGQLLVAQGVSEYLILFKAEGTEQDGLT